MTLSRKSSQIYLNEWEAEKLVGVLERAADSSDNDIVYAAYYGAAQALKILLMHDFIDTQADFMVMLKSAIKYVEGV